MAKAVLNLVVSRLESGGVSARRRAPQFVDEFGRPDGCVVATLPFVSLSLSSESTVVSMVES